MYEWKQRVRDWYAARVANAMKVGDLLDFIELQISQGTITRDTPLSVSSGFAAEILIDENDDLCIYGEYD